MALLRLKMRPILILFAILIAAGFTVLLLRPRSARAAMLNVGDDAPNFSAEAIAGDQIISLRLLDYRGRRVILYFYPKDSTPGCTREACAFRDGYAKLQNLGITVLGCSVDGPDAHRAFAKRHSLPFPLLLDPDKRIAKAYGADNGIPILGLDKRVTYVIGEDGRIAAVYPQVDPATHVAQIIHDFEAAQAHPAALPAATSAPASPVQSPQQDRDIE